eukprot:SAG25_NODE_266_length_10666_cov_14.508943_16_plen_56_part_01
MNVTFNVVAFTSNFIPTFLPRYCEPGTQTVKDGPWYNTPGHLLLRARRQSSLSRPQ